MHLSVGGADNGTKCYTGIIRIFAAEETEQALLQAQRWMLSDSLPAKRRP
jgi:hypothetical protein